MRSCVLSSLKSFIQHDSNPENLTSRPSESHSFESSKNTLVEETVGSQGCLHDSEKINLVETAAFEKYYPTSRRYFASGIEMRPPTGPLDNTAYSIVKNEHVRTNAAAARGLNLPDQDADNAEPAGVMTERGYSGDDSRAR